MSTPLEATAEQLRETCKLGRQLCAQREKEGESEALNASIALALRGAFSFVDVMIALMPPDPPRRR